MNISRSQGWYSKAQQSKTRRKNSKKWWIGRVQQETGDRLNRRRPWVCTNRCNSQCRRGSSHHDRWTDAEEKKVSVHWGDAMVIKWRMPSAIGWTDGEKDSVGVIDRWCDRTAWELKLRKPFTTGWTDTVLVHTSVQWRHQVRRRLLTFYCVTDKSASTRCTS